jgi:hypothetical protein
MAIPSAQAEVDVLNEEYKNYILDVRRRWLLENRPSSQNVWEVMSDPEREEVEQVVRRWKRYMTPITENWWRVRGYEVTWPEDDSQPMLVRKLESQHTTHHNAP